MYHLPLWFQMQKQIQDMKSKGESIQNNVMLYMVTGQEDVVTVSEKAQSVCSKQFTREIANGKSTSADWLSNGTVPSQHTKS